MLFWQISWRIWTVQADFWYLSINLNDKTKGIHHFCSKSNIFSTKMPKLILKSVLLVPKSTKMTSLFVSILNCPKRKKNANFMSWNEFRFKLVRIIPDSISNGFDLHFYFFKTLNLLIDFNSDIQFKNFQWSKIRCNSSVETLNWTHYFKKTYSI